MSPAAAPDAIFCEVVLCILLYYWRLVFRRVSLPSMLGFPLKSKIFAFYPGSPLLPILLQLNLAHRSAPAPSSMT